MAAQLDRRRFLALAAGGLAMAAGAGAGAGVLWRWRGVRRPSAGKPMVALDGDVRAFFGELRAGAAIDRWTVVVIHDASAGGIPVVMATAAGERFQVDVLKRDDRELGVANTRSLSLYLCNRGEGKLASDEEHGLGAMALAHLLDGREAEGARPPSLLTLRERNARFPRGAFSVIG